MRLLLDTNIVIPMLDRKAARLPLQIRQLLSEPEHELMFSAASLWEISIKVRLGKLPLEADLLTAPVLISDLGLIELPVTFAHGIALALPEPPTRDPFDRLFLAQCACEGLRLVTLDRALVAHPLAWRPDATASR